MPSPVTEIEQHVSNMLQATKKLLSSLTKWSTGEVMEDQIYQEYNTLQSHFSQTTRVFEHMLLPMGDMIHLPDNLYTCLESTLSSGPSSLEHHLPSIKDAILKLLSSIRLKQAALREASQSISRVASQIDLNDPSTKKALDTLASQEDLVERSSVRKHASRPVQEMPLYLKRGERVKKISVGEHELNLESLNQLFEHHFKRLPESSIYILDSCSNVEYELEDMSDVKPYSILAIHEANTIQRQMMNEMRTLFEGAIEQSLKNGPREDVSLLHQEIAILKRTHETYRKESQELIEHIRAQSNPRNGMEEGREIAQTATCLITNRLETLQDNVDQLKQDITRRRCRPSKSRLKHCQDESGLLAKEMADLASRLRTYRPVWKKMWENELQQIVQEQQFLKSQETLLSDLQEDHKAILDILEQAKQISDIHERKKRQQGGLQFKAPMMEGFEGMTSVLKEVCSIHVDHDRRLRALDEAERLRSKALAQTIDAFERELTDFVCLKKLKKTGGPKEVDKQREIKDKAIMRQMFSEKSLKE